MGFWIFISLCSAAVPITMIIIGAVFKNGNPKKINNFSGFRTVQSMKSEEAWKFANTYCGTLWFKLGLILLPANIAVMMLMKNGSSDEASIGALVLSVLDIIVMTGAVMRTQKELKKRFDEFGRPINMRNNDNK